MNNRELFYTIQKISLIVITTLLTLIIIKLEKIIEKKYIKIIFNLILLLIILFSIMLLPMFFFFSTNYIYESCGEEFNNIYIESSKTKDSSFCYDENIKLNKFTYSTPGYYCKTPNKDMINLDYIYSEENPDSKSVSKTYEDKISSCITSFNNYIEKNN